MASQKQIDANRANAQQSTGPKTPEGKAASSLNALKHGLTAKHAILHFEEAKLFNQTLQAFLDQLQPVGPVETLLVQQIVMASWRLTRLRDMETGLFEMRLSGEKRTQDEKYSSLTSAHRLAHAFYRDCTNRDAFTTLARYETRVERAFYRALHELQRLQSARRTPPHQPAASPQPPNLQITKSPDRQIPRPPTPSPQPLASSKSDQSKPIPTGPRPHAVCFIAAGRLK